MQSPAPENLEIKISSPDSFSSPRAHRALRFARLWDTGPLRFRYPFALIRFPELSPSRKKKRKKKKRKNRDERRRILRRFFARGALRSPLITILHKIHCTTPSCSLISVILSRYLHAPRNFPFNIYLSLPLCLSFSCILRTSTIYFNNSNYTNKRAIG